MSVRSVLTSSHLVYQARPNSLLPFLYHTQTLLSPAQHLRSSTPSRNHRRKHRNISSTSPCQVEIHKSPRRDKTVFEDNVFARPKSIPSSDPALPFEDAEPDLRSQKPKQSTMTASEKAVFDRIFKDIDQTSAGKDDEEAAIEDEHEIDTDPFEDLNSIFDTAIQRLRLQEEVRARSAEAAMKPETRPKEPYQRAVDQPIDVKDAHAVNSRAFIPPITLDNGVVLGADVDLEENEGELRKACEDHNGLVMDMLERANTDVGIWEILEEEVFALVKQLDAQVKWEEKARKAQEREERKAAKVKSTSKEHNAGDGTTTDQQSTHKAISTPTPKSVALPTTTLFSILRTNYATYLLSALRLLRRHHPTSFYAYSLLPTIRHLGPISYVLGASTSLYNELLFLKWTQFNDLHGMADLMQEMLDQGIEMNEVTWVFIRRLCSRRRYGRMGRMGPVVKAWWEMRGNVEGWRRVWGIYEGVRREEKEKREREALVVGSGYEGEGDVGE